MSAIMMFRYSASPHVRRRNRMYRAFRAGILLCLAVFSRIISADVACWIAGRSPIALAARRSNLDVFRRRARDEEEAPQEIAWEVGSELRLPPPGYGAVPPPLTTSSNRSLLESTEVFYSAAKSAPATDEMSDKAYQRVNIVSKAQQEMFEVPDGVSDTERGVGAITGALKRFPADHTFQAVGRTDSAEARDAFVRLVVDAAESKVGGRRVAAEAVSVTDRMNGKFVSVSVVQRLDNVRQVSEILEAIGQIPGVVMRY
eukprot:TRINITY_DN25675_c0_g2_i2.p2 TRINITY_DN25675_c0_g2~~TRINITY_DN25675_c0_g2_i2.p2  ORF type:complete len:258 (-),score=45.46 TRINITY_DN25675_c0_g2_i2:3-776(-)